MKKKIIFLGILGIIACFHEAVSANIFTDTGADIVWPIFFKAKSGEQKQQEQKNELEKWKNLFLENHKFEKYISVDGENTSLRLHAFYLIITQIQRLFFSMVIKRKFFIFS
ncbi:hypothetical protein [Lactococcus lactis]|uniref:hypothetical protein n=1 Tax=Lactococcus lactis TaxID=1358 RepID=UPI001F5AA89C|nr:hypothetical protein [Lactococcus lactis]